MRFLGVLLIFLAGLSSLAEANPVLENVAQGTASVSQTATTTTIQQRSPKAILNWNSFNIAANESTQFIQPQGGIALNRINAAQGPSEIYGHLTANSTIILTNGAGIHFGPRAEVNVGGLIATTLGITDQHFLKGQFIFDQVPRYPGVVTNEGRIQSHKYGLIALVGSEVSQKGLIKADLGTVILASAEQFTLGFNPGGYTDGFIHFVIQTPAKQEGAGVHLSEKGKVFADGGTVIIRAETATQVLDNIINLEGVVQANSVEEREGHIIITASSQQADANKSLIHMAGRVKADPETCYWGSCKLPGVIEIKSSGGVQFDGDVTSREMIILAKKIEINTQAWLEAYRFWISADSIHLDGHIKGRKLIVEDTKGPMTGEGVVDIDPWYRFCTDNFCGEMVSDW